jgi:carbamoyl-phosphate synthase large subunit
MEKSVLILGAAALQVPIIKYVKERGYNVIVVSIPGNYPGFKLADKSVYCDVRDVDSIMEAIKDDQILAVLTDETDITVPTVALLADKLGLAGNDPHIAEIYANKFRMRQQCQKVGVSVPRFFHASTMEEVAAKYESISYPAIMKPEDNQGSRGIYILYSKEEIALHFAESINFSKTRNVIVEEYFKGKEVVVEGFVYNGQYLNFGIAERRYFDIDELLIPCQTIFPAIINDEMQRTLIQSECKLHASLKPSFGMIHSEYLINEDTNEYILVETALRGGGVYISSHLVPYYSGINNYELLFDAALGKTISLEEAELQRETAASGYVCFTLPEGEIISVEGVKELRNIPSVKVSDVEELQVGTHVGKMVNKTQRLGPIILKADNRETLEQEIIKIQNTLTIRVKSNAGLTSEIIWK